MDKYVNNKLAFNELSQICWMQNIQKHLNHIKNLQFTQLFAGKNINESEKISIESYSSSSQQQLKGVFLQMKMLSLKALIANCILIRLISIKREEINFVNFRLPRCCEPFLFLWIYTIFAAIDWCCSKIIIARLTCAKFFFFFHSDCLHALKMKGNFHDFSIM